MKALSLTQPMALAIFHGKDVENRNWSTKYRGRIYIHASKKFDGDDYRWIVDNDNRLVTNIPEKGSSEYVYGAIIGEVTIIDCVKNHGSRWFVGTYGFVLKNPVMYAKPIPCRGQLSLFEPGPEVEQAIRTMKATI